MGIFSDGPHPSRRSSPLPGVGETDDGLPCVPIPMPQYCSRPPKCACASRPMQATAIESDSVGSVRKGTVGRTSPAIEGPGKEGPGGIVPDEEVCAA